MPGIRRREFVTLLGGVAAAWPLAARAQQANKLPLVGFFSPNTRSAAIPWTAAFVERLREVGWIEGRTIAIEYRWGEGRGDRTAEVVAEFVRLKPDVIVTHGQSNIIAAKEATSAIPIVFALATDPVASGFVASLARPGATPLACRSRRPILSVNASNSCARSCRVCAAWPSCPTSVIRRYQRLRPLRACWGLK